MAVPRIRCSAHAGGRGQLELHYWRDRLAADPALRRGHRQETAEHAARKPGRLTFVQDRSWAGRASFGYA
jgi:hypothetical protein